jgi:hypothetical protein
VLVKRTAACGLGGRAGWRLENEAARKQLGARVVEEHEVLLQRRVAAPHVGVSARPGAAGTRISPREQKSFVRLQRHRHRTSCGII